MPTPVGVSTLPLPEALSIKFASVLLKQFQKPQPEWRSDISRLTVIRFHVLQGFNFADSMFPLRYAGAQFDMQHLRHHSSSRVVITGRLVRYMVKFACQSDASERRGRTL